MPATLAAAVAAQPAQEELSALVELLEAISAGAILVVLLVLAAAYALSRVVEFVLQGIGRRAPRARFFFNVLAPAVRIVIWIGAGLIILFGVFSPSETTLLAVLASVGIALGLGAQDLVKNLIGGIAILIDRPYQLGDRVRIGEAYGEIDYIGLHSTKLTTPDDTRVTIPNGDVLTGLAWNANSGNPDCQVVTDLFLPHDADPVEAAHVASEAAYSSPYVLLTKPVDVRLQDRFQDGPFTLVRVKAYVYDHRFERAFQTDITTRAKSEFLRRGMLGGWSRHDHARAGEAEGSGG
ncbi:MAG TPA: mechanosensitive ion channel domain-containing protein [Longimicrobiales bacterium]|nr:mechanosensitive ion channel domain-containing protein [Longimicrobiales bacterium]